MTYTNFYNRQSNISNVLSISKKRMGKCGVPWVISYIFSLFSIKSLIISIIGHCYLMQDDLQKAYSAYQQALYLLPNPKVCIHISFLDLTLHYYYLLGRSKTLVWNRHPLRPIWFIGSCRGGLLLRFEDGQRLASFNSIIPRPLFKLITKT